MVSWKKLALGLTGLIVPLLPAASAMAQDCYGRLPAEPITLNLRDANIQTTLRLMARQYRINMVVTDEVKGAVTLDFFQVPARDVFRAIVETGNLQCVESAGVLRVSTISRLKQEEEERAKTLEAKSRAEAEIRKKQIETTQAEREFEQLRARGPVKEVTIRLSYADAEQVATTLQGILGLPPEGVTPPPLPGIYAPPPPTIIGAQPPLPPTTPVVGPSPSADALAKGLTVKAHKPTNSVFIRYYEGDLERITKLIKEQLDIPLPQVQIAAQMVITTQTALEQIGVQWGGAGIRRFPIDGRNPALIGSGFATGAAPVGGTGVVGAASENINFSGSALLPVSPTTGFPVGGNIVNLPTAFLPTGANPALGLLFGIVGRDFNLNLAIQALETQGKAKSLAEPKIVTVENAKAVISRGFEVPFVSQSGFGGTNVQFKDALLQLQVTPNVIQENGTTKIRMKVLIENNEPDFTRAVANNPPIFKRKAETEVVIREGERLVIGGVMIDNSGTTIRKVPLFGDIPVLGWLFKSREITSDGQELIVIITPSVVAQAGRPAAR